MSDQDDIKNAERRQREEDAHDQELVAYLQSIGATNLAGELRDLRFRNRSLEARRWLDFHEARISYEEQMHDRIDQRVMSNQALLYDKAQAYMNFVVTLGYAGFFAIWNIVKNQMHSWDVKLIAVLLGVSLFVFIAWTLISMIFSSSSVVRLGNVLRTKAESREALIEAMEQVEDENRRKGLKIQRFWLPTFCFSVGTGFAAGAILLSILLADIIGFKFSLHDLLFPVAPPIGTSGIPLAY